MILPDTTLLVYAYNKDASHYGSARKWLEELFSGTESAALTWATVTGFLRVCTNRAVMERPLRISLALDVIDEWLAHPTIRMIRPGDRHWPILKELLAAINVGGNLITDAHLAALAIEHDCELCSTDTDFARFPGLRWRNPLRS
jgi:toxin-antitoxin system PIN domain toxin